MGEVGAGPLLLRDGLGHRPQVEPDPVDQPLEPVAHRQVVVDDRRAAVDDYLPVRNRFEGLIHRVRFDLGPVSEAVAEEERVRAHMTHQ